MRINKFLSEAGICSRRNADEYIRSGQVTVNDQEAVLGMQVNEGDEVKYQGKAIHAEAFYYLAFYKPVDCLCSQVSEEEGVKTIYDFLPMLYSHAKYAGRLDRNTSGLLLLSNDGDWIQEITHPSHHVSKTYSLESIQKISDESIQTFEKGVVLEEGLAQAQCTRISDTCIHMTLFTGYNKQIRRMADQADVRITHLKRIAIGKLKIDKTHLTPGKFVQISKDMI